MARRVVTVVLVLAVAVVGAAGSRPPSGAEVGCDVVAGDGRLLLVGDLLTESGVVDDGAVLVGSDGTIEMVGHSEDVGLAADGATTLICDRHVISPGLINAHDHVPLNYAPATEAIGDQPYDHRQEWRLGLGGRDELATPASPTTRLVIVWGELRQLIAGTTTIAGAAGVRGLTRTPDADGISDLLIPATARSETFPLGDANATTLFDSGCEGYRTDLTAADAERPLYLHIAEGTTLAAHNEFRCLSGALPGGVDVVADHTAVVQGLGLSAGDVELMAERGAGLVWSARSNLRLYADTAPVTVLDRAGVPIALGTDWGFTGSATMNEEMRCARQFSIERLDGYFDDRDLWRMATATASDVLGIGHRVGRLAPHLVADIAVFRRGEGQDPFAAVVDARVGDVALVLRSGIPVFAAGALLSQLGGEGDPLPAAVPGVAPVLATTGYRVDEIVEATADAAPLVRPTSAETSCLPVRSGSSGEDDADGDGVADGVDNCPAVFNPRRPLDGGVQADRDQDGAGDLCDPSP